MRRQLVVFSLVAWLGLAYIPSLLSSLRRIATQLTVFCILSLYSRRSHQGNSSKALRVSLSEYTWVFAFASTNPKMPTNNLIACLIWKWGGELQISGPAVVHGRPGPSWGSGSRPRPVIYSGLTFCFFCCGQAPRCRCVRHPMKHVGLAVATLIYHQICYSEPVRPIFTGQ